MRTVVFDFDSTLIDCESLEEVLKGKGVSKEKFEAITRAGMEGKMPFVESLKRRLALAEVTRDDFKAFGEKAIGHVTPGMERLISDLKERGVEVWVISGSFREAILPLAEKLKISKDHVVALDFMGPYEDKVAMCKEVVWERPAVVVGDGITDYELVQAGLADSFIVFTQHVKRESVMKKGEESQNVEELRTLLNV